MLLLPPNVQAVLDAATAFIRRAEVTVTRGNTTETILVTQGSFTQDARRSMRWNGSVTIPVENPLLMPAVPGDLLTPFGAEVTVMLGIETADGQTGLVPFGRYLVDRSRFQDNPGARTVSLTLTDLAERLAAYRFEYPLTFPIGTDVADIVNAVVMDRLAINPNIPLTGQLIARQREFGLTTGEDPWRSLQEFVAAFDFRLYYDRYGQLILDNTPVPDTSTSRFVERATSVAGAFEGRPPNVIVARGEPVEVGIPANAVVMDTDPASPTWAGTMPGESPYGRIVEFYVSKELQDDAQARAAGEAILNKYKGAGASYEITRPFDPTFDCDDVVTALVGTRPVVLAVDAVTVDLGGSTTIPARSVLV